MALTYGFFDAQLASDGNYDRVYSASEFAQYFHLFVGNGVFPDPATQLQVSSSIPASMQVIVQPGFGWINGYYAHNDTQYPLSISVAHASLPRIDAIVLRWVNSSRSMVLAVKKGTAAASPATPGVTRNSDMYEIMLASVRVAAGATNISQSAITDKRSDKSVCGWVTGLIDQIDTTNLFAQYNTAFNEWFNNIKEQLSGNVATNLQNQINDLVTKTNTLSTQIIPISRGGTGQTTGAAGLHALISAATSLSSSSLATGDYIALDDVSAATGKKVTIANLATYLNSSQGISKIATGSYTGTGTYGSSNPNSITFPFVPKTMFISHKDVAGGMVNFGVLWISGAKYAITIGGYTGSPTANSIIVSLNGKTIKFYAGDNFAQFNMSNKYYVWVALG